MHMQTVKAHRYGRERKVGDRYECAEKDVRLVKALGWAVPVPPEPEIEQPKPKRAYVRKDIVTELPQPVEPEAAAEELATFTADPVVDAEPSERPRRAYRRRDLKAED